MDSQSSCRKFLKLSVWAMPYSKHCRSSLVVISTVLFGVFLLVLGACADDEGGQSCEIGAANCVCYGNDTCNDGLSCVSGVCSAEGSGQACNSDDDCSAEQLCHLTLDICATNCTDDPTVCWGNKTCQPSETAHDGKLGMVCLEPSGNHFPDILSMDVDPSSISRNQTSGMTDQFVDISITAVHFEGVITDADAFIQLRGSDHVAVKDDFEIEGDTIKLLGVDFTWFSGLETGDYQVGATVVADSGEQVQELDLATITITP